MKICFEFPIRIKRIASGGKIIVAGDGRDKGEVEIRDGEGAPSWVTGLREALREYDAERRKVGSKRRRRRDGFGPKARIS